jgi:hypothetical protein
MIYLKLPGSIPPAPGNFIEGGRYFSKLLFFLFPKLLFDEPVSSSELRVVVE